MNINKNLQPIDLSIHYGEANHKDSLKAYKYENELKRVINKHRAIIGYHLNKEFNLPTNIIVKVSDPGDPIPINETFNLIELINDKLISSDATVCISTYEIYRNKGILQAMSNLHLVSPLNII